MTKFINFVTDIYFRDRLILVSFASSLFVNIILWIVLAGKFGLSREPLPLHFSVVYGIDFVGSARKLYQLPGAGLLIFFVNLFLGRGLYDREKLLSYFLGFATLAVQIIFAVAVLALVVLNS